MGGAVLVWCALVQIVTVRALSTWTYADGDTWGGQCASGLSQSPVNLVSNTSKPIERWEFSNSYWYKVPCTITNTGNTLELTLTAETPATVAGGELGAEFVLSHGILHWGREDTQGSEHLVKGEAYPLEIQLIHYNSKYGSYKESQGKKDGLAVFSTLHKLSTTDNAKLSPLIDSLEKIINPGSSFKLEKEIPANSFYPTITSPLYRYTGSLTSPPCTEMVTWTIFYQTNTVSTPQLAKLRSLLKPDGSPMDSTFRPARQLHSRTVVIGSAWLGRAEAAESSTVVGRTQKDYLQMSVKTEEVSWYSQPAPMWTVVVGGVVVVVGGGVVLYLLVKRGLGTHAMVPTHDMEMD